MAGAARLFPASPKPAGGPVTPAVRSPRVRFARAARDQRFQKVITQLQQSARKVGQHPPAKRQAAEAQAAARAPANEKEAGARANQVDDMKDAKVEKPTTGGFLAVLRAEIDKIMPKNLDESDKFMKGGESGQIKGAVGANVSDQKQKAAGPTETTTKAPPDTGKVEGKEVTAMPSEPAAVAPPVAGAEAMPAPKPQAEVARTATDASASADQKLKDAELTETQLKKANDPRFSNVLTVRDKAKETATAGPAKYRSSETQALNQAKAGALGDAGRGRAGLVATKNATAGKNKSRAQLAKEKDEAERKKVTDTIAAIFEKTKTKVESKLSTLEADAMAIFDAGADGALATMKSSANAEIDKFKDDRYSGLIGKGRWIADLFRDTPPEIKAIIARARQRFTTDMDALAVRVAALVDNRLAEAKAIVAAGQAEVKTYVAGLAPNLRSVGQKAEQDLQSKFDDLKQSIDDKAQDLAEKLAQKYKDASEKADAAAKEMEEANKGALRALAEKVGEIIKMLAEFADRVVSLFKKAAGVLKKIIADPIGFLGNLLSAIKQGISRFVSNIWTHIKNGFMQWLFGELTKGGVQIPDGLPSPGALIKLVLNVMGLTWANIRPKIVKKIGERAVSVLEKVVEILQKLFTGGPEALWAEMQAFVGNIKAMVLDAILDWVISKVITSAITKVASMFNPAGAIIQAIIMVYNVGSWLAANIGKILDFIESVLNSVDRIANGDIGGAASFIEQSLAKMIPILIGFLAGLLGLGGLGDKIKSFIKKVQTAVGKAVDFVIDKVFNFVKKIIGKLTGKGKKKDGKPDERTEEEKRRDLDKAVTDLRPKIDALLQEGVSPEELNKNLAKWTKDYNLTSLTVEGGVIQAVINPRAPITSAQKLQAIGAALEPILQRTEAAFLAVRKKRLSTKQGRVEREARRDVAADTGTPLNLPPISQVELGRDIRLGNVSARPNQTIYPGENTTFRMLIKDPGNTGTFFTPNVISGQKVAATAMGRKVGDNYPDILAVMAAAPGAISQPRLEGLVNTNEGTRYPGMIGANAINQELVTHKLATREETTAGTLNPMRPPSATRATERAFYGSPRQFEPGIEQQMRDATQERHVTLGRIFDRLRSLLDSPKMDVYQKPGGRALQRLAKAFERWLKAEFPADANAQKDDKEVKRALNRLEGALLTFLKGFK